MNLTELKQKPASELVLLSSDLGLDNLARSRKQDVIFEILKAHAKKVEDIHGDGVLEILQDGFGFLLSAGSSYLAVHVAIYVSPENSSLIGRNLSVWLHAIFGVTRLGLLYYFNFVQVPALADALADEGGPGPAAIGKYVAPRALLWFRMAAAATWLTGAWVLSISPQYGFIHTLVFQAPAGPLMRLGAWMGTIMLSIVCVLILPHPKKVLGIV